MAPIPRIVLLSIALVMLAACGREATPPVTRETISRPTTAATIRQGRVLVPQRTVTAQGGVPGVYVIVDGIARFRMVRTGKTENGRVEILSGLDGTELLVTGELEGVHDGSPVSTASHP